MITSYIPTQRSQTLPNFLVTNELNQSLGEIRVYTPRLYIAHFEVNSNESTYLYCENSEISSWVDFWIDSKNKPTDPQIEKLYLRENNSLNLVSIPDSRLSLKEIHLDGCSTLIYVLLSRCPNLEVISLNDCKSLTKINLGLNKKVQKLFLKNCELTPQAQEDILCNFTPTISSTEYVNNKLFFNSIVDLRGNSIDWGNRYIASKIRMLLLNNFLVLWDSPPPEKIIPIYLYKTLNTNGRLKI